MHLTQDSEEAQDMKKPYTKPTITSEDVYETLAAGCTFFTTSDANCDPDAVDGAVLLNS
jgi:hypothetical protein